MIRLRARLAVLALPYARLAASEVILKHCLSEATGQQSLRSAACNAYEALSREAMMLGSYDTACELLECGLKYTEPGSSKDVSERCAYT